MPRINCTCSLVCPCSFELSSNVLIPYCWSVALEKKKKKKKSYMLMFSTPFRSAKITGDLGNQFLASFPGLPLYVSRKKKEGRGRPGITYHVTDITNSISVGPIDLHPPILNMLHHNTKTSSIDSWQRLQRRYLWGRVCVKYSTLAFHPASQWVWLLSVLPIPRIF